MQNKIEELMNSEEFFERVDKTNSADEIVSVFAEHEIDVEEKDAQAFLRYINKSESNEDLTEEELEDVSGGSIIKAGLGVLGKALLCNRHTNWGRNRKKCICGYHNMLDAATDWILGKK